MTIKVPTEYRPDELLYRAIAASYRPDHKPNLGRDQWSTEPMRPAED